VLCRSFTKTQAASPTPIRPWQQNNSPHTHGLPSESGTKQFPLSTGNLSFIFSTFQGQRIVPLKGSYNRFLDRQMQLLVSNTQLFTTNSGACVSAKSTEAMLSIRQGLALRKARGHFMYARFNIQQFHVLPTQCIYVFCVDLRTNSDYFLIQH
jgi:hypothetical protein